MKEEATTDLLNILEKTTQNNLANYIEQYGRSSANTCIFSEYMATKNISAATIVKNCYGLVSKSYIHDILNGTKTNPSRDILLIICIAAKMSAKETRRVLETYKQANLYPKDTRDIIILTHINNKCFDLIQLNEELASYKLPLLGKA